MLCVKVTATMKENFEPVEWDHIGKSINNEGLLFAEQILFLANFTQTSVNFVVQVWPPVK